MDWRTSVSAIPTGNAGNRRTLAAMSRLAMEGSMDPVVVHAAQQAVRPFRERDPDSDFAAILADVRRRMRYTHDPLGAEVVKAPRFVIDNTGMGQMPEPMDCDDASTLTAAMLGAIGYQTKFVTVAVDRARPQEWSHVYVAARHPEGRWVALDPIVLEFEAGDEVPAGQLTAPRAYHEGAGPMIGMGCTEDRMNGLGFMTAGMYRAGAGASGSGGDITTRDLVNTAGGIFQAQADQAKANAAAQIAAAQVKIARAARPAPGIFKNPDGTTNMTAVALTAGAAVVLGLVIFKAMRRR